MGWNDRHTYFKFKEGPKLVSSWKTYPSHYKFTSFAIQLSSNETYVVRFYISFFDGIARIGGIFIFLKLFFQFIAETFAQRRVESLLINRLFHIGEGN